MRIVTSVLNWSRRGELHGHVSIMRGACVSRTCPQSCSSFDLLLMLLYSVPRRDPLKVTRRYNSILTRAFCRKRGLRVCLFVVGGGGLLLSPFFFSFFPFFLFFSSSSSSSLFCFFLFFFLLLFCSSYYY